MREQTRRGDQLEQELRSLAESASLLVTFVQVLCDSLRLDLEDALAEAALLREEVFVGQCQEQQIDDLKLKLLKTTRLLHAAHERHDCELLSLRRPMDQGNARMHAELTQETEKLHKK